MNIEKFVEKISCVPNYEPFVENPYLNENCSYNLVNYLNHLQSTHIDVVLVGEAPGYRGCGLTGIPFTDENQLQLSDNYYALGSWSRINVNSYISERSASAMWKAIREHSIVPLMWNAFPFHPYQRGKPHSNRTPTKNELAEGLVYLEELISLFDIDRARIFAIGKKAKELLQLPDTHYIRHPANDFKREFRKQFDERIGLIKTPI